MFEKKIASLILGISAILLSVAAGEIVLRVAYPCPRYGYEYVAAQQYFFQFDPRLGWRGRPNASGTFASNTFRVRVTHNELGHRSSSAPWLEGSRNVLVLGDSFAWGWGVEDDQSLSEVMMRRAEGLNVYNLAAPGYGTDQQYLLLQRFLDEHSEMKPDLVVVVFFENDWLDNTSTSRYGFPKPRFLVRDGSMQLVNVPVPETRKRDLDLEREVVRTETTLLNRLHLYNLVTWHIAQLRGPEEPQSPGELPVYATEEQNTITLRLFRAIAELARSRGADLFVVLLYPKENPPWRAFRTGLEEAGIPYLGFAGRFKLGRTQLWLDGHLNRRGHALLASQLLEVLDERLPSM